MIGPFTADHERFREGVRRFVERELRPHADRWERSGTLSRAALAACARRGWLAADAWQQAVIAEELPRCDSLGFALSVFVQSNLIAP
ncbi:MAG TPA: acyl-CoA dehydrogenase family protein, partial [Vicinamibacterales bacterium]